MTNSEVTATTSLTRLCNCCGERYEIKRTNPYCDWCRWECTNEGCTKPPAEDTATSGSPRASRCICGLNPCACGVLRTEPLEHERNITWPAPLEDENGSTRCVCGLNPCTCGVLRTEPLEHEQNITWPAPPGDENGSQEAES